MIIITLRLYSTQIIIKFNSKTKCYNIYSEGEERITHSRWNCRRDACERLDGPNFGVAACCILCWRLSDERKRWGLRDGVELSPGLSWRNEAFGDKKNPGTLKDGKAGETVINERWMRALAIIREDYKERRKGDSTPPLHFITLFMFPLRYEF